MKTVFTNYSNHSAPADHVTFSALDHNEGGHSASIPSESFDQNFRAAKAGLSGISSAAAFKGCIEIIRRNIKCDGSGCRCSADGLIYAFLGMLLKHPHKQIRKSLLKRIRTLLSIENGARVVLTLPPSGPSSWTISSVSKGK